MNPNNGNETKLGILGTYSNLTLFFTGRKTLKYFNDLYNLAPFNFIGKVSTNKKSETKSRQTCANLTVFFLISKVVQCLNDF